MEDVGRETLCVSVLRIAYCVSSFAIVYRPASSVLLRNTQYAVRSAHLSYAKWGIYTHEQPLIYLSHHVLNKVWSFEPWTIQHLAGAQRVYIQQLI
jgi:hypothetical protein